ncbi:hypothetical protein IW262DRAFT_1260680, partial [Armillaria fumosa]
DIWSLGCLVRLWFIVYRLSTDGVHLDTTEIMLFQMVARTCEVFLGKQLSASPLAGHHFNETYMAQYSLARQSLNACVGRLKKKPGLYLYQTEHWMVRNSDGDVIMDKAKEVVRFMQRCLRLDPGDRGNVKELLEDEWFDDAA